MAKEAEESSRKLLPTLGPLDLLQSYTFERHKNVTEALMGRLRKTVVGDVIEEDEESFDHRTEARQPQRKVDEDVLMILTKFGMEHQQVWRRQGTLPLQAKPH
eukprot:1133430-Prymnesium_polylepis.1